MTRISRTDTFGNRKIRLASLPDCWHDGLHDMKPTKKLPRTLRQKLSKWGSKGGKRGKRADKARAGKMGWLARVQKAREMELGNGQ